MKKPAYQDEPERERELEQEDWERRTEEWEQHETPYYSRDSEMGEEQG